MHNANSAPLRARRAAPLTGTAQIPGDKSISQRALILGGDFRLSYLPYNWDLNRQGP